VSGNSLTPVRGTLSAIAIIAACAACGAHASAPPPAAPAATTSAAETACDSKPAGPEVYVRTVLPGASTVAQELGGEYHWVQGHCLDVTDFTAATAGTASGECTTIGYVSQNPGYNANAAPPLKDIASEAGPGC